VKFFPQKHHTATGDYRTYLAVFLLALTVRCLFLAFLDEPALFYKYPFFAEKLAAGQGIGDRLVDLSPFYLYLLAGFKIAFNPDWVFVKAFQAAVGAVNCVLLLALGAAAFRKEVGLFAALLYAAYGNLIILETTLEPEVYVLLFNLLCVFFLYRSVQDRKNRWAMLSGLFTGLSILTKPNSLLLLPLGIAWLVFFPSERRDRRARIFKAAVFCGTALLVILPVTLRNHIRYNDWVLITADAGKVFYHGNGKGASALEGIGLPDEGFSEEAMSEPDSAHTLFRAAASASMGRDLRPSEASRFWIRKTLDDIAADIPAYGIRQAKKLFFFFNDYEMHDVASAHAEYRTTLRYPFIRYGIIASLAWVGMFFSARRFPKPALIFGMVGVYVVSGLIFLVQSRYRTPAVPYLCLFAGVAVFRLREMVLAKDFRHAAAAVAAVFLAYAAGNLVFRPEIDRMDRWQTATKIFYQLRAVPLYLNGSYRQAAADLDQCIFLAPDFSPAYNLRGKTLAILGNARAAENDFKTVIRLSPRIPEGYKNLGFLYLLKGDRQKAAALLRRASRLAPHDKKVNQALDALDA